MISKILNTFQHLIQTIDDEKIKLADNLREESLIGRLTEARSIIQQIENIEQIKKQIQSLQEKCRELEQAADVIEHIESSAISEEEEILDILKAGNTLSPDRHRDDFDSTESKKERLVGYIPQKVYRPMILEVLTQLGGKAEAKKVQDLIYERMKSKFGEKDLELLPRGGTRWAKMVAWTRYNMVQEGLLRNDSPRGIWAISDAGREYLEKHRPV